MDPACERLIVLESAFEDRGTQGTGLARHCVRRGPLRILKDYVPVSKLVDQIREALTVFADIGTRPALIGGLALAAHDVVRATQDVDFLVDADDADRLHDALLSLGYICIHRSEDAANYVRHDERLDFLYAHRPIARRLLAEADERDTPLGPVRVISVEGLIAFKLQAYVNDPRRTRDMDDIRALLRANHDLNRKELREYFVLFQREELLDELVAGS
ncbi:MAG: hypothetical protein CALGDGBN_01785 [Pseudomonadales bacterium]|nr:hypothetical protein [Pseudomonadales bacterium]